eukprot:jgi/Chrzof1/5999/Cz17g00060.t1
MEQSVTASWFCVVYGCHLCLLVYVSVTCLRCSCHGGQPSRLLLHAQYGCGVVWQDVYATELSAVAAARKICITNLLKWRSQQGSHTRTLMYTINQSVT